MAEARWILTLGLTFLCGTGAAVAQETAIAEAVAEVAQPATAEQIQAWITELDADKYATRSEATRKLIAAGKAAIEPVAEAAKSNSNEVSNRAFEILAELYKSNDAPTGEAAKAALEKLAKDDDPNLAKKAAKLIAPKPDPAKAQPIVPFGGNIQIGGNIQLLPGGGIQINGQAVPGGGGGIRMIQAQNANGVRTIEANENGRKVKIVDNPAKGITVDVTEKVEGKDQTKKYEAKNAEELKKKHPEAEKLYQQYAGQNGAGVIQIQALPAGAIPALPALPLIPAQPFNNDAAEKIKAARKRLQALAEQLDKQAADKPADASVKKLAEELKDIDRELGGDADSK